MAKIASTTLIVLIILGGIAKLLIDQRHAVLLNVAALVMGESPALLEPSEELPTTDWFDDYYTIDKIAPDTWAIGEPRYYQQNFNYLVVGKTRALLFDAGPGVKNILPAVKSITDLPLIFLPSHFHYDHVGNGTQFQARAVVDLPYLRDRANGAQLSFTEMEHLGPAEGFTVPTWQVDHWWAPGEPIDLGGRFVEIIHTPGHSKESISLLDRKNKLIMSGDYLYPGPLIVFVPGSSVQDYLNTAEALIENNASDLIYYGAHRLEPPGPPALTIEDLQALKETLIRMQRGDYEGEGIWPKTFVINEKITLLADPLSLQDWPK